MFLKKSLNVRHDCGNDSLFCDNFVLKLLLKGIIITQKSLGRFKMCYFNKARSKSSYGNNRPTDRVFDPELEF